MKGLYFLLISLLVIGCSDSSLGPQEDCFCGLDISSSLPQNSGMYELEYDSSLAQTYSVLETNPIETIFNEISRVRLMPPT